MQEYQTEKLKKELLINKNKELINLKEISTYNIEADVLNAKASEIRDSISNNKVSLYYAETLLNKADSLEKLAVQKQKIIISIIRRQLDEKAPNDEQLLAEAALYKAENITNKITNNTSVTSIIKDEKKSISKAEIIPNEDAKAVDKTSDSEHISNTKGLFYTVQVGVFGSPRTKERLFNLAPLFFEQMTNGYYRYLAGIYQNRQNAQQARVNNIIQYVPDAFVVAYYNGSRITMQEATKMENENIVKANEQPLLLSITNVTTNIAENQETKEKTISEGKIEFKVQIGAFRKEIDANALENFKQKTGTDNITFYTNAANLLCYTAGSFETQAEAQKLRLNIISAGISDAFVVAFMGGNRISLQRAN